MISTADIRAKYYLAKNLITDQTYANIIKKLNVTSTGFDATHGLGDTASSASTGVLVAAGGFPDQRITCDMKYMSPTAAVDSEIGVIARCDGLDTNPSYYYARVDGNVAKLTKVVSGTFTTLTSTAFVLPQGQIVTITLQCIGTALTATFTSSGVSGSPLTLTATDSSITTAGVMGFRSLLCAVRFQSFIAEEL